VVNQGGLSFHTVIIRFAIALSASFIGIFTIERAKNRIITVWKDNPPWLTTEIKKKYRKKNRQHKRAKKMIWQMTGQNFDELGTDAKNL
jgi:hypothetical protein